MLPRRSGPAEADGIASFVGVLFEISIVCLFFVPFCFVFGFWLALFLLVGCGVFWLCSGWGVLWLAEGGGVGF